MDLGFFWILGLGFKGRGFRARTTLGFKCKEGLGMGAGMLSSTGFVLKSDLILEGWGSMLSHSF